MKETKAFLKNQNDIYQMTMVNHLKEGKLNFIYIRDICNLIIVNTTTLKGIEESKKKGNGEK